MLIFGESQLGSCWESAKVPEDVGVNASKRTQAVFWPLLVSMHHLLGVTFLKMHEKIVNTMRLHLLRAESK